MTPEQRDTDTYRAAVALIAAAADDNLDDITALLGGRGWPDNHYAAMAALLAHWLATVLNHFSPDDSGPAEDLRAIIAKSVAREAREAGP